MVSLLLMASSRVMLLPASCLSTSAFFLHFRAKTLNFSLPKLRFKFNQSFTAYLFHLCLLSALAPKFQIFPAKTQIQVQSTIFNLPILSLPFTCVCDKISNFSSQNSKFFQPKLRTYQSFNQSFTAYLFYLCLFLHSRQNFKFFPPKLRTYQSFTDLCVFQHSRRNIRFFPTKTQI